MRKILFSMATLIFVGSMAAGATGAFFSDTQTSSSNIFTAGSIDLKIDHSLSTYNGSSDLTVVSSPATTFTGGPPAASGNAVNLTFVHPFWETIPGANWIWATDPVSDPSGPVDQTYTFTRTFTWTGPFVSASIDYGADNYYDVYINGNLIGSNHSLILDNFQLPHTTDVTAFIAQGVNTIKFVGENQHIDGSDFHSNPAGIIFKLVVHGQQTWITPVDLTNQKFWHFDDVKPGDTGRDVISLDETGNDAWACMVINHIDNEENTLTAPEIAAGDVTAGPGPTSGELGKYLHVFLWHDLNGDGNYNPPAETPITGTLASPTPINLDTLGPINLPVHDSTTGNGVLPGGTTEDIGSAWCVGVLSVDPGTGAISCDGTTLSNPLINQSQTDSTMADLTFYSTQARNQPTFKCSDVTFP